MTEDYSTAISEASRTLADALLSDLDELEAGVQALDSTVLGLVRRVGREVVGTLLAAVGARAVEREKSRDLTVHRRDSMTVRTVLGPVKTESPYMRNRRTKAACRPVNALLGLRSGGMTAALERVLTDFGAEESYEMAARRTAEHYGLEVGRTSILRVVSRRAAEAEAFVAERLAAEREAFDEPRASRSGADTMLVELDGCMIRTGTLVACEGDAKTAVREAPVRKRDEKWREVRVAFARQPGEVERTYVARCDRYERVVGDLFSAAVERGLSDRTQVYAVSDGGNGLREELDAQFPGLRFLLDRPHLKAHLFEAAAALKLDQAAQQAWVADAMLLIDSANVSDVIQAAEAHAASGNERMRRLAGYLNRFADALDYAGAKAADIPLGSGEIESAHRSIPQKRLKIPGACWRPESLNPMLALRVMRANGWWEDFWAGEPAARVA